MIWYKKIKVIHASFFLIIEPYHYAIFKCFYSYVPNNIDYLIKKTGGRNVKMLKRKTGQILDKGGKD